MKTQACNRGRQHGSVLLVTLIVAGLLGVTLCSYLVVVSSQNLSVSRSQRWNGALDIAEAGVEEALAHINASPGNFAADGWSSSGATYGPVTRNFNGGSYSVSVVMGSAPIIYSTGYVTAPITGKVISRAVMATTTGQQLPFARVPVGAVYNIQFNGNGVATDSWNSHNPNLSTNGKYDPNKISTNGSVASVAGLVNIGNHTILGNLYLGPTATYNNSGTVSGKIYTDYNVQFPEVQLPTPDPAGTWDDPSGTWNGTWMAAPVTTISTTDKHGNVTTTSVHDFTTSGHYYVNDSLNIIVEPQVRVILDARSPNFYPQNVHIVGDLDTAGTLVVYQESGTINLSGNITVDSQRPENLWFFGMHNVTSIVYGGTTSFMGVMYAPDAVLTLNGGGNNIGIIGACIVKSITMNGHYNFHYDESLSTNGPTWGSGYIMNSWTEL